MPGKSGIEEAVELARASAPPLIVFVTAYDQYALRAFEISTCDYLLKPFDAERLDTAMVNRAHIREMQQWFRGATMW